MRLSVHEIWLSTAPMKEAPCFDLIKTLSQTVRAGP